MSIQRKWSNKSNDKNNLYIYIYIIYFNEFKFKSEKII